jgi:hypothetical protein
MLERDYAKLIVQMKIELLRCNIRVFVLGDQPLV